MMNYIFFSESEGYKTGVKKLKKEADKQRKTCKLIEIRNFKKSDFLKIKEKSVVYFLTNSKFLPRYLHSCQKRKVKIINKLGLIKSLKKLDLQKKLKAAGICIPQHSKISKNMNLRYPIFIKSQKQADDVIYIKNKKKFIDNKIIRNNSSYYLEEAVNNDNFIEKKFYYISGSSVEMKNLKSALTIPYWFQKILIKISFSLELEVFSTDIFIYNLAKKYFCIDVNPAPSFFRSDQARKEFVKKLFI